MNLPSESSDPVISPFNDVQERVRQFNDDEAVWRCFEKKRARRKQLLELLRSLNSPSVLTDDELDRLDWLAAEREARPVRVIGVEVPTLSQADLANPHAIQKAHASRRGN